jgi:two-component system sensor histidine kinase YesM
MNVNQMIEELELTIQRTYVAQLAQKEAENRALLSQIQPHFLFNTLNSLIARLYENNTAELEQGMYSLSDMLHYVLREEETVQLHEEVTFVTNYLILQQSRFKDRLRYIITMDEKAQSVIIPRLLLQPFVENAIIHGIEPGTKMSTIEIRITHSEHAVLIIIKDDGVGFDENKTDIMKSVGISNSVNRLKLFHMQAKIKISGAPKVGCTVAISIPVGDVIP